MLLLKFPELKTVEGKVTEILGSLQATTEEMAAWHILVNQKIDLPDEDAEFD